MLTLAASCWLPPEAIVDVNNSEQKSGLWLVKSNIFLQIAVNLQDHKTPFSPTPKNPASTHFFWGYIFFHRKPRIHTSNGRTIGPTYQRFIYQWMLSHSTMSFLPSPLILDILMLKTLVKCSHPRKNHKLRWQIKRSPYTKILKNTRIQTANPNRKMRVTSDLWGYSLTPFIYPQTHTNSPHWHTMQNLPIIFLPTSRWWDLNSINPKAVKVGAIVLLDPMVWCHGGRQWWHLIREDTDDSHGHDELVIDCFYILHQIDAWWLFNMYMDDLFTSW